MLWVNETRKKNKKKSTRMITSRPINLPIHANKCKILLLLKLVKTSAAVILPRFKASSQSINADGVRIFLNEWRRKRPFLKV